MKSERSIAITVASACALLAVAAGPARAQNFPADADWEEFHCGTDPMWDAVEDEPTAVDERDVVGDDLQPAGFHYADADYAYLRLRVDADPTDTAGDLRPFAWGFEFDTDGDATTYEVLVMASGISQSVLLFSNDTVTLANDPSDPADDPPFATYSWAAAGRAVAAGSDFGGDGDGYLDMAIPWDDLEAIGMTPITPIRTWAASSSQENALDGDFACHDGASGDPALDDIGSDDTVTDPNVDSDGDGYSDADEIDAGSDPNDPDSIPDGGGASGDTELQGGGGCSAAGGPASLPLALLLLALVAATRGGRRSRPSARR